MGRIAKYALESGVAPELICEKLIEKAGLICNECDYERIATTIAVAVAAIVAVIATRARNREALRLAQDAIAKAMRSSKLEVGKIELEKANGYIAAVQKSEEDVDAALDNLVQVLKDEQDRLGTGTKESQVNIIGD